MVAIMEQHMKKTGRNKLPLIYPTILYTGEKPYPYSMDLFSLFENNKELAKKTLTSPYPYQSLTN